MGKAVAAAGAALYPFLSVCVVFLCVRTVAWLPVLGICVWDFFNLFLNIFYVCTDVDACDCIETL